MPTDLRFLQFADSGGGEELADSSVYGQYLSLVANGKMRTYKEIVHDRGKKQGQSYYSHVLDLTALVEKLREAAGVQTPEMQCLLLALTIHDMNKIPPYNKSLDGREAKYAEAAISEHIAAELERLEVDLFFPQWRTYLQDIVMLAQLHQESATGTILTLDQRKYNACVLPAQRVKGPLKFLMKAADVADNSHSGDQCDQDEAHIRDKLLQHINAAMPERQYRFFGHRLAELRGIFTNVIHNELVSYFRDTYGKDACIDLLYYPEGVNYLLDQEIVLDWGGERLKEVAERIQRRLANVQLDAITQFIKARPAGIVVDDAAISSGASNEQIFEVIATTVLRKRYKPEWHAERHANARNDLEAVLAHPQSSIPLKEQVAAVLQQSAGLIPNDEMMLRRGEFASAYRKFLEDHRRAQLKDLKIDAWTRVYRLFKLPEERHQIYAQIDPFRRGYVLATDLPALEIDAMKDGVLADLEELEQEVQAKKNGAQASTKRGLDATPTIGGRETVGYIEDYLKRNLEIWERPLAPGTRATSPIAIDFADALQRYANPKRPNVQCCHCGNALPASEWISAQVPPNIGVQSFSNRLEGGSLRDPKRNVCDVCRMQFILEKLAWRSHDDKQGGKQSTFYLHLFPYAFFTNPMLSAWWKSIEQLRDSDHRAFLLDTKNYFRAWTTSSGEMPVRGYRTGVNGLGLPVLSETVSTTPVFPIVAPGENYGLQFLLALEEAVVLARWFECRVFLSRSPVPPLNLAHEYIDGTRPVVLMVEGMPRNMSWLVPTTSLDTDAVQTLCRKLSLLHQITEKLYYRGADLDALPHDFAVQTADDPLALFHLADRQIEKKVAQEKTNGQSSEHLGLTLRRQLTTLLRELISLH